MTTDRSTPTQEFIQTTLVVQVETIGGQYLRGRLLPPWRSQVVGRDWKEVENKLRAKAVPELSRAVPRKWLMSDQLNALPQRSEALVELAPFRRGQAWHAPVPIQLDSFRWDLPDGMCLVKVPAVRCDLFGKATEITHDLVADQIRLALLRLGDHFDLWDVRQRFFQSSFSYRTLTLNSPLKLDGHSRKKSSEAEQRKQTATLRSTASDLSRAELEPVFGRDQQVADVAEYLVGQSPQSVLLVGPAGVGKTAIVHRLVQTAEQLGLGQRKIWSTTGSRLVSGMSGMGMWQERCLKLIREAHATHAIVHVGSVIELMEAGKIEGQPGVASMIRQAVGRGRLLIIAECTPQQLALVEREEPLLLRALVRYDVSEPETDEVRDILRQAADYRVKVSDRKESRRAHFTDHALEELNRLHRRYASYSALPAQPLRLMQTILERSSPSASIDATDVARAFASQTGLPRFLVDDSVTIDLERIRSRLASHIIGQPEPVDLVVNLIATLKSRMVRPGRPLASLLFIGPTGVGKTEMAKALAGLLYSDTRRMVRIDMSEYASPWAAVRLIGRPDEGDGTLTSPIREQPFSVVLLDEFEKADPAVFDMLLQLLGEGRLTDSLGRLADFRNAVVIMTSNLGVESFRDSGFGFAESGSNWRSHFEREVQRFIRPELLGRIDRIVPFSPLAREVVRQIAERELNMLKERPGLKYADVRLEFDTEVIEHVCQLGYQPKYGARPLRRAIEQHVTVPLANQLAELNSAASWTLRAVLRDGKVAIDTLREELGRHQQRKSAERAIDAWQVLGRMARLAMNCSPLRDLENETQRLQRINDSLFEKLKDTTSGRRANSIKNDIQQHAVTIERNKRVVAQLNEASERIVQSHQQVMLDWYRNVELSNDRLFQLPERLQVELRTAVVGLLEGRSQRLEFVSVLLIGKQIGRAAVLWQAYQRIAQENGWKVDCYSLKMYDAVRDRESAEYRKRQSQRKMDDGEAPTEKEPVMRLLGHAAGGEPTSMIKTCDVYREDSMDAWNNPDGSTLGVALQLSGFGISAWMSNEWGVVHFLDANPNAGKRRLRFRVVVEQHRLIEVQLPQHWPEPVAIPDRDPRRTFNLAENVIVDGLSSETIACGHSKQLECLIESIHRDRERELWAAVDFTGIPASATLQGEPMEEPSL